ncbi:hypothetical protein DID75_03225 [Candidatus Marinamargulisbacteria bacterium SCGC AG-410-N11]|nr:hypothetical protein DID75_03225 [Candidatus Marinamargulisbacteria bacterium SCGC AG-410-N11]
MTVFQEPAPLFPNPTNPLPNPKAPLAFQLAPKTINEFQGQSHLMGVGKPLRNILEQKQLTSLILWGPPGCGKTSYARLVANHLDCHVDMINAVTANIAIMKQCIEQAKQRQKSTLLFIDEIHRFSKTQQDALLPSVESGLITLLGATTENPYFSVISGLVSRCQIVEFKPLSKLSLTKIYDNALDKIKKNNPVKIDPKIKDIVIGECRGDARKLVNYVDIIKNQAIKTKNITLDSIQALLQNQGKSLRKDDHYDLISAFIKSMRGSDPDATVYWLSRLLDSGEDPRFIARRLVIFASEDIGTADPHALPLATAVQQAATTIGLPEIEINLSHVAIFLATAPKSNATYEALKKAKSTIKQGNFHDIPNHLRDSHYKGAKKEGFGQQYQYPHDDPKGIIKQDYLPQKHTFYTPKSIGYEKIIQDRIRWINNYIQKEDR